MNFIERNAVAVVALVIAILGCYLPVSSAVHSLGGTSNFDTLGVTGLQVGPGCNNGLNPAGCTGTNVGALNFGTCNIQSNSPTIAATTTVQLDCNGSTAGGTLVPLTGVTTGANVDLMQASTSPTTFEGLQIRGASASSTPGSITLFLYNGTGNTFTWTAAASSSFAYQVLHS